MAKFMVDIKPGDILAVAGASERYWLCRATKAAERASGAFTSQGNHIAARQWFAGVECFGFERETAYLHREFRAEPGVVHLSPI